MDKEATLRWKATKARLRLQYIKQGFLVPPPMNLLIYFLLFVKWLVGFASGSAKGSSARKRDAETEGDVDVDVDVEGQLLLDNHNKREIQDNIHRRYMIWVEKKSTILSPES